MRPAQQLLDSTLVLRYQTGDAAAFEQIVERYYAPLRYFVRSLTGNADAADDVLQEVWLTVLKKLGRLRSTEAFSVWLYRIARNKVYDGLRGQRLIATFDDETTPVEEMEDEGEFSPADAARIHQCLRRLTPEHRGVLVLRFMEEMSYEDVARVVGCKVGTVRSRIHYAKRALRRQMEATTDEGP